MARPELLKVLPERQALDGGALSGRDLRAKVQELPLDQGDIAPKRVGWSGLRTRWLTYRAALSGCGVGAWCRRRDGVHDIGQKAAWGNGGGECRSRSDRRLAPVDARRRS